MALRHIDLCYDHTESDKSAIQLLHTLLPEWKTSEGEVELVRFTDGITNTVCPKQSPGHEARMTNNGTNCSCSKRQRNDPAQMNDRLTMKLYYYEPTVKEQMLL